MTAFDFSNVDAQVVDEMLTPDEPTTETVEPEYDTPDASFIHTPRRPNNAGKYEKKIQSIFNTGFRAMVEHEATVPDAAAIAMYGPSIASKAGDLAAQDERFARAIDMLTEGTENPALALAMATAPLLLQVFRNHEPVLEPAQRGIRIPFTKNKRMLRFKFGIKLGRLRAVTHDPDVFADYVFSNPELQTALTRQGIKVAGRSFAPGRSERRERRSSERAS